MLRAVLTRSVARWQKAGSWCVAAAVLVLVVATQASATEIPLIKESGVYSIPVRINGVITLDFIIDSGAAEVQIPADVMLTLLRAKTIRRGDILPGQTYSLADGSAVRSNRFVIRELQLGDLRIRNVTALIGPVSGDLLLGQSVLERLPAWSLDNRRHVLIVAQGEVGPAESQSRSDGDEAGDRLAAKVSDRDNGPVASVRAYYASLSRGDADAAIEAWASPNEEKLRMLIGRIEWFRVNAARLLEQRDDHAIVAVDLTGKNRGEPAQHWAGTIDLTRNDGSWRIVTLRHVVAQGRR